MVSVLWVSIARDSLLQRGLEWQRIVTNTQSRSISCANCATLSIQFSTISSSPFIHCPPLSLCLIWIHILPSLTTLVLWLFIMFQSLLLCCAPSHRVVVVVCWLVVVPGDYGQEMESSRRGYFIETTRPSIPINCNDFIISPSRPVRNCISGRSFFTPLLFQSAALWSGFFCSFGSQGIESVMNATNSN